MEMSLFWAFLFMAAILHLGYVSCILQLPNWDRSVKHAGHSIRAVSNMLSRCCCIFLEFLVMDVLCLDLEGVLVPEIWIAFSEAAGLPELRRTTRDEPDYDKLMRFRLDILDRNGLKLDDIRRVIGTLEPLEGAREFVAGVRRITQLVILSDTFTQFAGPLMEKLGFPTLFCNTLEVSADGKVTGYRLRQKDGKRCAVKAFHSMNMRVMASGDSFNDLGMIREADDGALFRTTAAIKAEFPEIPAYESYGGLLEHVRRFCTETSAG